MSHLEPLSFQRDGKRRTCPTEIVACCYDSSYPVALVMAYLAALLLVVLKSKGDTWMWTRLSTMFGQLERQLFCSIGDTDISPPSAVAGR